MKVEAYLNFDGRCEEALEFYRGALDAQVTRLMRYKDMPGTPQPGMVPPGTEEKVMHSSFQVGNTTLLASDCHCQGKATIQGISLALEVANDDEAERRFAALSVGGQVQMPLTKTFFSSKFGTVTDRFGVTWMLIVEMHS